MSGFNLLALRSLDYCLVCLFLTFLDVESIPVLYQNLFKVSRENMKSLKFSRKHTWSVDISSKGAQH